MLIRALTEVKPISLYHIERLNFLPEEEQKTTGALPLRKVDIESISLERHFPNVTFGDHVQVIGIRNIEIGRGSCIGDNTWLNICVRDEKIRMRIGDCVLVGRQSMISTGGYLEIGDFCIFAPRVYISDADHIFDDITQPIIQQGATLNRSVVIEENCWLGINAVIAGCLTVGRGSIVAANAVVIRDVPPFSVVVGNPARIAKMYNPQSRLWERVRSQEEIDCMISIRTKFLLPERREYRATLHQNSQIREVPSIVAGRGECI